MGLCDTLTVGQYICVRYAPSPYHSHPAPLQHITSSTLRLIHAHQPTSSSPPGTTGVYSLAPPPLGTSADAGNQQRGGAGGVVTPTTTVTTTGNPASGGPGQTLTQDGIATNCNNYASAASGEGCHDFAVSHGVAPTQFYAWNPVLGSDGANCSTAFWASEYYCVGTSATATGTSSSSSSSSSGGATTPTSTKG